MILSFYLARQTVPGLEIMAPRVAALRARRKEKKSTMATAAYETYSTTTVSITGSHFMRPKHSQYYTVTLLTFPYGQPSKGPFLTFEDLAKSTKTSTWTSGPFSRSCRPWLTTMCSVQRIICPTPTPKLWKRLKKRPGGSLSTGTMLKFLTNFLMV